MSIVFWVLGCVRLLPILILPEGRIRWSKAMGGGVILYTYKLGLGLSLTKSLKLVEFETTGIAYYLHYMV